MLNNKLICQTVKLKSSKQGEDFWQKTKDLSEESHVKFINNGLQPEGSLMQPQQFEMKMSDSWASCF